MMRVLAPAKVNLYLDVNGRRDDGYHFLESLMVRVSVCDVLELSDAQSSTLSVTGPFADCVEHDDQNIVMKAVRLLSDSVGSNFSGVHINLQKNIPVGAGLGGGSADAAAVLLALKKYWQLGCGDQELQEIAIKLGADVPFCVLGGQAMVSGVGEILSKVESVPELFILLVYPGVHLSTRDVFEHFDVRLGDDLSDKGEVGKCDFDNIRNFIRFVAGRGNDLESSAVCLVPEIADVLAVIGAQDGCLLSRMSGSGSTCFGVFENEHFLADAVVNVANLRSEYWVQDVVIVAADEL